MKQRIQHKINKIHAADTDMPSRESVSIESLTENTLPDDEKGEDEAKRLHEKALYAEQKRPMTIGEKSIVAILYAICAPCFAAIIVSFFVIYILNFTKSGPDVCKILPVAAIIESLIYFM